MSLRVVSISVALVVAACSEAPKPVPVDAPAAPATVEKKAAEPSTPAPLSEEDLALIAADPKDLTPEMRRKRAYALRRKIMQNPDSPTARMLEDLQKAHENGTLQVPGPGVRLQLPGTPPDGGPPPAGARPSDPQPPASPQ